MLKQCAAMQSETARTPAHTQPSNSPSQASATFTTQDLRLAPKAACYNQRANLPL